MALLYLGSGFFEIQPGGIGIVFRFGRPIAGDALPGLHYRLPWPLESDQVIDRDAVRRVQFGVARASAAGPGSQAAPRQDLMFGTPSPVKSGGLVFRKEAASDDSFFLTGDGNLIDLRFTLHYRVKDARAFALSTRDPEALVRSTALSVLRAAVATSGIDAVYTTERGELEARVSQTIQQELDRFKSGLQMLSVHFLYVHPPDEVHDSFRDVASAQEDKLRTVNRANTFAIEEVNESKGEAAAMIEQALGFKEDRIRRAQGDADAFTTQMESYRQAPELAKFRLRLEAAEQVLPGTQKIITPGGQAVENLDMWLPHAFKRAGDAK
jgi:HflK protein